MKIGVVLESMGLPLRQGLPQAARLGIGGLQVDIAGDLAPDRLTETGRRELKNLLRTYNQQLTALNCPLRRGLDVAEHQHARIDYLTRPAGFVVTDLGSRNGVYVNGRRIAAPTLLQPGDQLAFGAQSNAVFRFEAE